jgi:hypothetical protein
MIKGVLINTDACFADTEKTIHGRMTGSLSDNFAKADSIGCMSRLHFKSG